MYDRPETAAANDRLWAQVRARLGHGPDTLSREHDHDLWKLWEAPDLLLAQTCGLPLRTRLAGRVELVGSLINTIPGCPPGYYFSNVVVHRGAGERRFAAFAGARLAYNQDHSQSGWGAAQNHAADHGFTFHDHYETGAHRLSALEVAEGRADITVIDAVSWSLIAEHDACAAELVVIDRTSPTPGLPVICGPGQDVAALRAALAGAIAALSAEDRATLRLAGLAQVPLEAYHAVPNPPAPLQP